MNKTMRIVWVGLRRMLADPIYLIFTLGLPVMMTWLMSFLPKSAGVYELASLGVLVMFVGLNLITTAGVILEERQQGTWQRLLAAPVSYRDIMAGYFIKMFLLAWIQTLLLLLSGKFLFGAPWNKGYPETVVVITVYIFAMTGLGLFLAGILKTQGQVQAVAMAVILVGTMLGNIFFPIDTGSRVIEVIAGISPQSRAAHALKEVLMNGASLSSLWVPLLWMGVAGLVFLVAGTLLIKYHE